MHLEIRGDLALTVHDLSNELAGGVILGVLVSQRSAGDFLIKRVSLVPSGSIPIPESTPLFPVLGAEPESSLDQYFTTSEFEIDALDIYRLLAPKVARQMLSGHIVALRYQQFMLRTVSTNRSDFSDIDTWKFKFNASGETSLTKFTARNYELLTMWRESSPAQVLAAMEGVSVITIRNRLHSARETKILGKPGAGKRSAPKIS